jgi:anti-sigma regulatory factor (Ser/Thr protein kinase)
MGPLAPRKSPRNRTAGSAIGLEVIGVSDTAGVPEPIPPATRTASDDRCAEWSFPAEPGAVRAARSVVRSTLNEWELNTVGDVTVLLVSELVTNALRHASGPIGVRIRRNRNDALLVEVSDPLPELPLARDARPDDEGGRGLQLVARTSRRWGTRRGRTGKTVWFELALPG